MVTPVTEVVRIRPQYDQSTRDKICELLMLGNTLTKIVKMEGMPTYRTVIQWLQTDEQFKKDYEYARDVQYDKMSDDILDIADNGQDDVDPTTGKSNWENVNRSRLKVESRKWLLAHMRPGRFGEKQQITADIKSTKVISDQDKFDMARLMAFHLTGAKEIA